MAHEDKQKSEGKAAKAAKSDQKPPKGEGKPAKEKDKDKDKAKAAAEAPAEKPKAPPAPPRPPADPRLKVLKKFHGRFLPRGPLRDRLQVLMTRWNSGEDHGGVTVDELKKLYTDWLAVRAKSKRAIVAKG